MKNTSSISIRPAKERGHADHGWLKSYHTFSFADYQDEEYMGFRSLRVINEDRVDPGKGFGAHPHHDMEIFSYVIEGALAHKDSMGHTSTIKAGDVQKITAGAGIVHSEYNASNTEPVHFLQIWILPAQKGLTPSYQEYSPASAQRRTPLTLIGSPQGGKNVIQFHQDIYLYKGQLKEKESQVHAIKNGRGIWLQMIQGKLKLNDQPLSAGDGAAIDGADTITLHSPEDAEFLLMDMA